jgi:glycosyltransferase involved in cell wall biosynthesis
MKLCLISSQIAAWGKIGGFGTATRALGAALAQQGLTVTAVVPRRAGDGQGREERLDGMTVFGLGSLETLSSGRIYRTIDADVYHSQEPTMGTYLAQRAVPDAVHVVTCRDPRGWSDHWIELRHSSWRRRLIAPASLYYEASPFVRSAVRHAHAVVTPAPSALHGRIKALYGEAVEPMFIPSPVDIPAKPVVKASTPVALFVGRFDRRKRIELFFELARKCPDVRFIAIGRAHEDAYDDHLRRTYGNLENLEMPGFVPRFGSDNLMSYYERAWILVNTSAREGLPYSFLEAGACGMAVLSSLDPEGFASRFGHHVTDGNFEAGLRHLLAEQRWKRRGQAAASYVSAHWSMAASVDGHLGLYSRLLRQTKSAAA